MAPKAARASMSIPKKPRSHPAKMLVVEETHEASSSTERFPKDYIPPRNPSAK